MQDTDMFVRESPFPIPVGISMVDPSSINVSFIYLPIDQSFPLTAQVSSSAAILLTFGFLSASVPGWMFLIGRVPWAL